MKMRSRGKDLFAEGSYVEVSSEAKGFPGRWYVAKMLKQPPSATSMDMVFLVEYQNLYSSHKKKLTGHVGFEYLRPLPPPPPPGPSESEDQTFEVNDVVDAFVVDGWWVGVVCEVLEEAKGYSVLLKNPPDLITFKPSELRVHLDWVGGKWVRPQKQIMQHKKGRTLNQKREGGNPSKPLVKGEGIGAEGVVDENSVEDHTPIGAELTITGDDGENKNPQPTGDFTPIGAESTTTGEPTETATEMAVMPSNMADVDAPMSCLPIVVVDSSIYSGTINRSSEPPEISNEVVQHGAGATSIDSMADEDQFVESSPVMRFIQSMEVFQSLPQKPHFRPLAECEEVCREGLALGLMMTFVNVVKKIPKLQVITPECEFGSLFKCLDELELHGFDVKAVRSRLLELQSLKENRDHLITKSKKIRSEILEPTQERTKANVELEDIMKELKVFNEKKTAVEEKKMKLISRYIENHVEIDKLKSIVDLLAEEMQKAELKRKSLAASIWK